MKKLLGILVLGLMFSLFTSQTISKDKLPGCKIPKKPKEKIIEAPEAILKQQKTPTSRIEKVLAKRKTINVFRAWNKEYGTERYGLYWTKAPDPPGPSNLSLMEVYWNYHLPNVRIAKYPGIEKFLIKKNWDAKGHGTGGEYGKTIWVDFFHPDFAEYFANLVFKLAKSGTYGFFAHDGIILDWWHNEQPGASKNKVKKARKKIAEAIRNKMGKEFIILANTGWFKDRSTHNFINGVFLELSKWVSGRTEGKYSCSEILYIEKLIKLHDQHLSEPRIIAVGAKKITKPSSKELDKELEKELAEKFRKEICEIKIKYGIDQYEFCEVCKFNDCSHVGVYNMDNKYAEQLRKYLNMNSSSTDRSSPENIQFAKLFTAMAMVIPENGYILYGDNNRDSHLGDHYHTYYDFYNTDLGKAISDGVEITKGLGYKKYEKGLIAYNRTKIKYTVKFKDGKKVEIGPLEGVFVKD